MDKEDVVYIYTMECYSAIKKNKIMPFAVTWMDLVIIIHIWSKSERERQIPYDISYVESKIWTYLHKWTYLQKRKRLTDIENKVVVAKVEGVGEGWIGSLGLADANYDKQQGPIV